MPRQQELRIGLRDDDGLRSRYWKVIVDQEADVYIAHETLTAHDVKISLHASGRCHLALPDQQPHLRWQIPPPQVPGFINLLTIGLLPGRAVTTDVARPHALYPPAPPEHIRYFTFIYEHPQAVLDSWPGRRADRSELVARLSMTDGVRLCVITTVQPFVPREMTVPVETNPDLDRYADRTEHGLMLVSFGTNDDGSVWVIEGPVDVHRND